MSMTTTNGVGKPAAKWTRDFEMVVTRRRKLLGFSGLTELVKVGLYTDPKGYRRRVELVRLGCAHSVEQAIGHATLGMLRHPAGTRQHRVYRDWSERLLATQRVIAACEAKYRRQVAEMASGLPYREQRRDVAVLRAPAATPAYRPAVGLGDGPETPPAA